MYGRQRETRKRSSSTVEVLDTCVVGGSIAGLAVAFTLASAGHKVTVFERSDGKNNRCGAIKLPPNGTMCLNRWGLKAKVDKFSRKFMKCNFIQSDSDRIVGTLLLNAILEDDAFLNQDVAEYTCITDAELWDWLYKLALDTGATVKFNSKVTKVDSTRPSITLESGEEIAVDLIVGADGVDGITRSVVSGGSGGSGSSSSESGEGGSGKWNGNRFLMVSCTLPIDEFAADPELETLLNDSTLFIWAADDVQLKAQMNKGEKTYTLALVYKLSPNHVLDPSIKEYVWDDRFKLEDFPFIDYTNFTGRSLRLLNMCKGVKAYVNVHTEVPSLDDLVSDSGKVVLIGSAAHGMPPGMQHNTSFGFEDAETLGYLFSRIPSRSLIPRFLMAYEEIRSSRIANASAIDVSLLQSSIMQAKLLQDRLDALMTKQDGQNTSSSSSNGDHGGTKDDEDEDGDGGEGDDELSALWSETLSMWLYDANEKVDDWWSKWGPGIVREYWEPEGEATAIYVDRNISHQ